jgi:hypothetical protein
MSAAFGSPEFIAASTLSSSNPFSNARARSAIRRISGSAAFWAGLILNVILKTMPAIHRYKEALVACLRICALKYGGGRTFYPSRTSRDGPPRRNVYINALAAGDTAQVIARLAFECDDRRWAEVVAVLQPHPQR